MTHQYPTYIPLSNRIQIFLISGSMFPIYWKLNPYFWACSKKEFQIQPQPDLSVLLSLISKRKISHTTSNLLSTIVKINGCLQIGWYSLFHLISCRCLNFSQMKRASFTIRVFQTFLRLNEVLQEVFWRAWEVGWLFRVQSFLMNMKATCVKSFTEMTQFSLYERQTLTYKLVCKMQKDSGLLFRTFGSAQPQLEIYFFLNSPSCKSCYSTAKP